MRTHTLRPIGHRPLTNPDPPRDAGRNTPAARNYTNARRAGRTHPGRIDFVDDIASRRNPFASVAEAITARFNRLLRPRARAASDPHTHSDTISHPRHGRP